MGCRVSTCPVCQREIQDNLQECPHCGVIFAKWKGRASNNASERRNINTQLSERQIIEVFQRRKRNHDFPESLIFGGGIYLFFVVWIFLDSLVSPMFPSIFDPPIIPFKFPKTILELVLGLVLGLSLIIWGRWLSHHFKCPKCEMVLPDGPTQIEKQKCPSCDVSITELKARLRPQISEHQIIKKFQRRRHIWKLDCVFSLQFPFSFLMVIGGGFWVLLLLMPYLAEPLTIRIPGIILGLALIVCGLWLMSLYGCPNCGESPAVEKKAWRERKGFEDRDEAYDLVDENPDPDRCPTCGVRLK